ncbi:sporulation-delaying protein SdpB family protein [Cryobacterium sp. PH31-L1]|uniref:sporulation-delaying protein SdpB family protein n=1 Tax=Cryobacterium sp. PH31-L1 TaxID=3046199 RepID=UPI0024BACF45|nr:sporulation-delaying protein SdpB family protein [Cryobacterium sp. PH31-L1]MDJ0376260.1 HTTM domain-containing protein [Cryobacterium sp. PH31-L1]
MSEYASLRRSTQVGRSVIAAAQLSILALTSWANLTPEVLGHKPAPACISVVKASLFCVDTSDDKVISRFIAAGILILVIIGFLPAVTAVLHAWVAFSLSTSIGLPDGGDSAAAVVTIIIIFITARDTRLFAWGRSDPIWSSSVTDGIAWGAWWILRLQMAFIYIESGLSKFGTAEWMNGSAMHYVVRDPSFGASGPAGLLARGITNTAVGTAAVTWGTIVLEVAVGVLILAGPRARRWALSLVIALHLGIIIVIGLWSFAGIMMGAVIIAATPRQHLLIAPDTGAAFGPEVSEKGVESSIGSPTSENHEPNLGANQSPTATQIPHKDQRSMIICVASKSQ